MKKKKVLTIVLLCLGAALALFGLIVLYQAGSNHTGVSGGVTRASTSIQFGADFYTTSAQYSGLAANAVVDLYTLVSYAIGAFSLFFGGLDICIVLLRADLQELFGKKEAPVEAISETAEAQLFSSHCGPL